MISETSTLCCFRGDFLPGSVVRAKDCAEQIFLDSNQVAGGTSATWLIAIARWANSVEGTIQGRVYLLIPRTRQTPMLRAAVASTTKPTRPSSGTLYSVLTGICVGVGTIFFFLLFQKGGPLSAVPMVLAGGAALMALIGILFMKEPASGPRLLGIALSIFLIQCQFRKYLMQSIEDGRTECIPKPG